MERLWILSITCVIFVKCQEVDLRFPENFTIGTATSSYQIEGAWNAGDKGENSWDRYTHASPDRIDDGGNGDIACNSYYKYKEDVEWIRKMGLDFYRFSISWARILPNGFANEVSQVGLQYYKNLTSELLANGIEPVVTLYHWDHPQILEDLGGWTNEMMVEWFADYARIIFEELGPMVKTFVTINEPGVFCNLGYNLAIHAPGKLLENMGHYICVHNVLKAHATAYHMYDEEFRAKQQGEIGLTTQVDGWVLTNDTNATVVEQNFQFSSGWIMHPIYFGDYPEIMKTRIAMISGLENYPFSRLPEFSEKWIQYIKGTTDFYGLNHYTSYFISSDPDEELGVYNSDSGIIRSINESWPFGSLSGFRYIPEGFGNLLREIKDQYNNPPVYVLENGYADSGELDDYGRINFYYGYLKELISAVKRDGCNVQKYTAWSLLDNFEWSNGYIPTFGLVHVNFSDPDRARTAKLSTAWWQSVAETRILQEVPVGSTTRT